MADLPDNANTTLVTVASRDGSELLDVILATHAASSEERDELLADAEEEIRSAFYHLGYGAADTCVATLFSVDGQGKLVWRQEIVVDGPDAD
jgi:hypothetical protein